MLNPPDSLPGSGSYVDLLKRMTQGVKKAGVNDRILQALQQVFENELARQNVVLSRPERKRLFKQVMTAILNETLSGLQDSSQPNGFPPA